MVWEKIMKTNCEIIAEIGNSHEGNIDKAYELIDAAIDCGCKMIKFQAGYAKDFARKPEEIEYYKKFELPLSEFIRFHGYGRSKNIDVFFSIWSEDYEPLRKIEKYHKIPARQCNYENIEKYDSLSTFISIPHYMKNIQSLNIKKSIPLHCIVEYPATKKPYFNRMMELKYKYGIFGFSDHFIGIAKAMQAVLLGATYIEKHFTLDHNYSDFRDHKHSTDPKEMKELVKFARGW